MRSLTGVLFGSAITWMVFARLPAAEPPAPDPAALEFFEKKVRPALVEHCYKCHSSQAKSPKGGLRLDSRSAMLKGGDSGPALVPGEPDKSRMIEAVRFKNVELQMPPKGKLPDAVIADLASWVKMRAPWPDEKPVQTASKIEFDQHKRKQEHWAWQPIRPVAPPSIKDSSWPQNPVDRFILAKLEAKGLKPAAPAERRVLVRRLYLDLIGLPPTPEEMERALRDKSENWLEKLVDELLSSPHLGERWARHWLDLVRYGESRGHEFDYVAPNAYQYRDYVIRAFNADVPYNQFVIEHIAGDLLPTPRMSTPHPSPPPRGGRESAQFNESILGTGFWFLGEQVHSPVDIRQDEGDRFDNMVDVFGKTFLGLTISCARCHDHKFDAISTKDYYGFYGFLQSSSYRLAPFESLEHNRQVAAKLCQLRAEQKKPVQRAVAEAMRPTLERLADYLLAAKDAGPAKIEEIAREKKLNPELLAAWIAQFTKSAKDETDPLHPLTRSDPAKLLDAWRKRTESAASALNGAEVVVDFAQPPAEGWLPDGFAFGPEPVKPGDIRFGADPAHPILQIYDYAAAQLDPAWDRLRPAAGAENDPGPLGSLVRAGRMIRTPTFELKAPKLYYLVKGSGQVYASVDSHTMINGPLHGKLVQQFKGTNRFQWVTHGLDAYQGHRLHVELTAGSSDFAVAMVVQGEKPPPLVDRPSAALLQLLEKDAETPERMAQAYQRLFLDIAKRLEEDRITATPDATDTARLANWLVQHPDLFDSEAGLPFRDKVTLLLGAQQKLIDQIKSESRLAMALLDGSGENDYVFIRGNHKAPGEVVPRRFLEALAGNQPLAVSRGSGRLQLARQVIDPKLNPFIARVMVNRVWHHLFGRGIVASVDNFGVLGEPPTHPELLDWLADRFVQDGWSIKKLIRLLVLSRAYQMSATAGGPADEADPQDLLLHRQRIRRLEGEAIRDAMLLVSGRLDRTMYGPSVPVYLTEFMQGRGRPASGPLDGNGRRSLYLAVRRNFLAPMLLAFDTPIPFSTVGRRTVSNVPAQSLILLNDPFVHQMAELWARRVLSRPGEAKERIAGMYLSAFGRPPTDAELAGCLTFLGRQGGGKSPGNDDLTVWTDLAHTLFNVKEFIFLN